MPGRLDANYYATDLVSDILGRGKSSRLYDQLVKERKLFNSISASCSGSTDTGLLIIQGKLNEGVDAREANAAIEAINQELMDQAVREDELTKVKNQAEASIVFSEIELLNRAMNLAYSKLLGDANLVNLETAQIQAVTVADIQQQARAVLRPSNCATLFYYADPQAENNDQ